MTRADHITWQRSLQSQKGLCFSSRLARQWLEGVLVPSQPSHLSPFRTFPRLCCPWERCPVSGGLQLAHTASPGQQMIPGFVSENHQAVPGLVTWDNLSLPGFSPPPDLEAARMLRAAGLALPSLARDTSSCKKRFIGRLSVFLGLRATAGGEALSDLWDRGSAQMSLQRLLSPSWLSPLRILESPKRQQNRYTLPLSINRSAYMQETNCVWEAGESNRKREHFAQIWWKNSLCPLSNRHALNKACLGYVSFPATGSQSCFVYWKETRSWAEP